MKKGFTLIELLIVISIIGILAVALLPNIISAPATARDAGRKTSINSVISAMEQYKAASGSYASAASGCLPTSLNTYFKGGTAPTGFTPATVDAVFGCNAPAIQLCNLATNNQGYSYVVAIRMEQPVPGANGMAASTTCASLVNGSKDFVPPTAAATNMYYYMAQ